MTPRSLAARRAWRKARVAVAFLMARPCMQVSFELDAATQGPIGPQSCGLMSFSLQTLVWFLLLCMHLYWCGTVLFTAHAGTLDGIGFRFFLWADAIPASSRRCFGRMFPLLFFSGVALLVIVFARTCKMLSIGSVISCLCESCCA